MQFFNKAPLSLLLLFPPMSPALNFFFSSTSCFCCFPRSSQGLCFLWHPSAVHLWVVWETSEQATKASGLPPAKCWGSSSWECSAQPVSNRAGRVGLTLSKDGGPWGHCAAVTPAEPLRLSPPVFPPHRRRNGSPGRWPGGGGIHTLSTPPPQCQTPNPIPFAYWGRNRVWRKKLSRPLLVLRTSWHAMGPMFSVFLRNKGPMEG